MKKTKPNTIQSALERTYTFYNLYSILEQSIQTVSQEEM